MRVRTLEAGIKQLKKSATKSKPSRAKRAPTKTKATDGGLTKAAIEAVAVPPGKFDAYLWDPGLPSFGVRKTHAGGLSFVVKFTVAGKQRKQSLGKVPLGTKDDVERAVKAARKVAHEALANARINKDFKAEDREKAADAAARAKAEAAERARVADRLGDRIETYLAERSRDLRPRSHTEVKRHLAKHVHSLHDLPVTDLKREVIAKELSRIAEDSGAVAADRVRASLSAFCAWLIERQVIDHNPCSGLKRKANGGGRERVLTPDELKMIWRATASTSDHDQIVRLLLLTGQRREEIGGLRWSEVDLARRQINLPPERTKNGRPHIVPLSDQAVAIIEEIAPRLNRAHVFGQGAGGFSGWSKCKERLDARLGAAISTWTLHDLRRTFASHAADLDFGSVLAIEAALNHLSGERAGIKGIYNRGKQERQKRELMEKWGAHILGLVEAAEGAGTEGVSAGSAAPEPQLITDTEPGPAAPPMDRAAAFRYFLGRQRRSKRKSPRRRTRV